MTTLNSQEVISEVETVERNDLLYHQDTNKPVTGVVEEFYYNGQLQVRTNFIDGERDGLWEIFYKTGQLSSRGNYKDGKEDGLREHFDIDGNLTKTEIYKNGELRVCDKNNTTF